MDWIRFRVRTRVHYLGNELLVRVRIRVRVWVRFRVWDRFRLGLGSEN